MTGYTLFEWRALPFRGDGAIPEASARRLAVAGERASTKIKGRPPVFRFGRDELRAQGVVGVVAAGPDVLEILPKVDAGDDGDVGTARSRLIHMLAVAHDLPVAVGDRAMLGLQRENLLEQIIGLFAGGLAEAVRRGMPRRYQSRDDDLPALRSRLDTRRQFTRLAASPQMLACRFDELSADTLVNRIMKAALRRLLALTSSPTNERLMRELLFAYADIGDLSPGAIEWSRVTLGRTEERWRGLIAWAKLLLSGEHQTTSGGGASGWSLLFDMGALFERYIARMLRRALAGTDLSLVAQGGMRPCLYDEGGVGRFATMPDLIVKRGEAVVLVADTKWKRLSARIDDPKQGVAQADVYQMMAYSRLYGCGRSLLLYPHHAGLGSTARVTSRHRVGAPDGAEVLTVASVALDDHLAVIARLRELMLDVRAPAIGPTPITVSDPAP